MQTQSTDTSQLTQALLMIDEINKQDPTMDLIEGIPTPTALVYGQRMSQTLLTFMPQAPLSLQIASRAQHIKRWSVPRADYPLGRTGYLAWRKGLGVMHADVAMDIAKQVHCSDDDINAIGKMIRKEQLKRDPLVQTLEDVACLVFLSFYFTAFCEKHAPEKIISIVQKTWKKMSDSGHEAALKLPFTPAQSQLLQQALSS